MTDNNSDNTEQSSKHSKSAIFAFIASLLAALFLTLSLSNDYYVIAGVMAALLAVIFALTALFKRKSKKHFAVSAIIISMLTLGAFLFIGITIIVIFGMLFSFLFGR